MDTMDVIEVDPKLFVTCRLCLEELGQYQIVPRIQQQIKFCYDIDVLPFDGLPQLICMKCKDLLTIYFNLKTTICEKQTNLKNRILKKDITELCNQPQQNTVSSSQLPVEHLEVKENAGKRKKRVIHSSDSETSDDSTKKKNKISVQNENNKWDSSNFNKYLVCKICNRECADMRTYSMHSQCHTPLKTTYHTIFTKSCSVTLQKIDNKPNLTGKNNIVVFDNNRIIQNCSTTYYIRYSKDKPVLIENNRLASVSEHSYTKHGDSDSNDSDKEIVAKPNRRKRRVLSRSSNETVVIESNNRKSPSDNEDSKKKIQVKVPPLNSSLYQCINIDDSSDSDQDRSEAESRQMTKQRMEAKLDDYKTIQGIITTCAANYHKKNESSENTGRHATTEYQLKRKLLNIGRRILNRQGFNNTGLLKFMEYKNLDIVWLTKSLPTNNNKESNYIRIMTKLRETDAMDDNQGWAPIDSPTPAPIEPDTALKTVRMTTPTADNCNQLQNPPESAVLFMCSPPDPKNKLLNANPVANPKQLPRKFGERTELRVNKVVSEPCHINEEPDLCMPIITSTTSLAVPSVIQENKNSKTPPTAGTATDTPTPRIKVKPVTELMSERMLNSLRKEQNAAVSTNNLLQKELEETSNILQNQLENTNNMVLNQINNTNNLVLTKNIWMPQSVGNMPNLFVPNIVPQLTVASQPQLTFTSQPQFTIASQPQLTISSQPQLTITSQPQLTMTNPPLQLVQLSLNPIDVAPKPAYQVVPQTPAPETSNNTNSKEEFVLLNTVELPNTKTNSPFKYLRKLSRIHNLTLFDPFETLPQEFVCLIKFKVQFKQEPIDEPVVLCLSLFCFKHKFCFTVRDRNQKDININKISPNWQWEILNVFRGDLVDKLLQNAQKHSQETHDYTKKFLSLLKSISFKKLS